MPAIAHRRRFGLSITAYKIGAAGRSDALITIADTGCGIPKNHVDRVGRPFVRAENTLSRKFEGSGLGLSIARKLCTLHGGTLPIDSIEGKGTTVQISLPLVV